jgi:uncharacterized protein (DUF2267 family)
MTTGTTGIEALDRGVQEYNQWIKDIADRLGTPERRLAHRALRAVLHALRDRVGAEHAARFAAQLPPLVRAVFFEGYQPAAPTSRENSRGAFLEQVHTEGVQPLDIVELEHATKAVLAVMGERLDHSHIENLISLFPEEFSDLWPDAPVEWDAPVKTRRADAARRTVEHRVHERPSHTTRTTRAATGIEEIDLQIQAATQWSDAVEFRINPQQSSRTSWAALAATLQAIRAQLSPEAVARFAANLPLPLQGIYYEGWQPGTHTPTNTRSGFLQRLEITAWADQDITVERAVKAAMEVIARKVPAAEMAAIVQALPKDLHQLWPDEPAPYTDLREVRPLKENVVPPPPPARGAKNIRRARNRAPGQTTRHAVVVPKPGKRAH